MQAMLAPQQRTRPTLISHQLKGQQQEHQLIATKSSATIDDIVRDFENQTDKINDYERRQSTMAQQLKESINIISDLRAKNMEITKVNAELQSAVRQVKELQPSIERKHQYIITNSDELKQILKDSNQRINENKLMGIKLLQEEIPNLHKKLEVSEQEKLTLQGILKTKEDEDKIQRDNFIKNINDLEGINKTNEETRSMQIQEFEIKINSFKSQLDIKSYEYNEKCNNIIILNEKLNILKQEYNADKGTFDIFKNESELRHFTLVEEKEALEKKFNEKSNELHSIIKELKEANKKDAEERSLMYNLRLEELAEIEVSLSQAARENEAHEVRINNLEKIMNELHIQLDDTRISNEVYARTEKELKDENQRCLRDTEKIKAFNEDKEKENIEIQNKMIRLRKEIDDLRNQNSNLIALTHVSKGTDSKEMITKRSRSKQSQEDILSKDFNEKCEVSLEEEKTISSEYSDDDKIGIRNTGRKEVVKSNTPPPPPLALSHHIRKKQAADMEDIAYVHTSKFTNSTQSTTGNVGRKGLAKTPDVDSKSNHNKASRPSTPAAHPVPVTDAAETPTTAKITFMGSLSKPLVKKSTPSQPTKLYGKNPGNQKGQVKSLSQSLPLPTLSILPRKSLETLDARAEAAYGRHSLNPKSLASGSSYDNLSNIRKGLISVDDLMKAKTLQTKCLNDDNFDPFDDEMCLLSSLEGSTHAK